MALDVKISFSWTNYCRLCLLDDGIMLPLFDSEGQSRQLGHKIEACFQLVTYDGDPLPRKICHQCLYKINQTHEFRNMAMRSYERLKAHLLPLKHVPEVALYLEKSDQLNKSIEVNTAPVIPSTSPLSTSSRQVTNTAPVIPSTSPLSSSSRGESCVLHSPKIRIKSEKELMDASSSLLWSSVPSNDFSHLDSSISTAPYNGTPVTSLFREPVPSLNDDGSLPDSLKRKRLSVANDGSSCEAGDAGVSSSLKRTCRKRQLAGPSSWKKRVQNSQLKCVFCLSQFGSKHGLNIHLEKCLRCGTCSKEFSSIADKAVHEANEHISVVLDSEKKHLRKRCTRCPSRFASGIMLSMHSKYDHVSPSMSEPSPPATSSSIKDCTASQSVPFAPKETNNSGIENGEIQLNGSGPPCDPNPIRDSTNETVSHNCETCNASFDRAASLQKHEREIHGIFKCTYCSEIYPSLISLNTHKRTTHYSKHSKKTLGQDGCTRKSLLSSETKKMLSCHTCYEEFEEEDSFILHIYKHATEESDSEEQHYKKPRKGHSMPKQKKATLINATTINDATSANGVGSEKQPEQFSIKCERCHVVCRSKEYYQVHLATHVSKAKTNFPCSGCNQVFRNVEALNRHTCCGKQTDNVQTCCLDCGQALVKNEDHICDNKCPECDKVFKSARGQRLHFVSKHRGRVHVEDGLLNDVQLSELETNPMELEEDAMASVPDLNLKATNKQESPARGSSDNDSGTSDPEGSFIGESPPQERLPPDGAPPDGSPLDGAPPDGSLRDGFPPDGAPPDELEFSLSDPVPHDTALLTSANKLVGNHSTTSLPVSVKPVSLLLAEN